MFTQRPIVITRKKNDASLVRDPGRGPLNFGYNNKRFGYNYRKMATEVCSI